MRTNINFAMNFHKHYPNHNKNLWAESLTKGDLIMLNDRAVVYISHETKRLPNGMAAQGVQPITPFLLRKESYLHQTISITSKPSQSKGDTHENAT